MAAPIVAGVGMIAFRKPGESDPYDVMGEQAARSALEDAGVDYADVQRAFVGYVFADSCAGQAALHRVGVTGVPVTNVSNNCSSGSTAFALAAEAVSAGAADCVLALGFEQMKPGALESQFPHLPAPTAKHSSVIAAFAKLDEEERKLPVALQAFGCQTDYLTDVMGVEEVTLARIAVKARRHAANNPVAMLRTALTEAQVLASPTIFRSLRKAHACPPSCGSAAVVVCSEEFARRRGIDSRVRLIGSGWASDGASAFTDAKDIFFHSISRDPALQAYAQAGVGPGDIDVAEVHDCFASNELMTYVALAFADESNLNSFVADGENTYGGEIVVNPSGGLLSKGHPLGATGLAQLVELTWQLRGVAGARQVEGARLALQHNVGLGSAGFVHILQRHEA